MVNKCKFLDVFTSEQNKTLSPRGLIRMSSYAMKKNNNYINFFINYKNTEHCTFRDLQHGISNVPLALLCNISGIARS